MAKKKTPPEYGESDCSQSQYCCPEDHVIFGGLSLNSLRAAIPESGRDEDRDKVTLTGPMMVACQ
jgi:hypothetical protein